MKYWTRGRWASFTLHLVFVSIPFGASTVSSLLFWQGWFRDWIPAALLVVTLDVLALTAFVTTIARINWPLKELKHLLPVISVVPLGYELFLLLRPNGDWPAAAISIGIVCWFTWLAFILFGSLERLFIDPITAARERAEQHMLTAAQAVASFQKQRDIVYEFIDAVSLHRQHNDEQAVVVVGQAPNTSVDGSSRLPSKLDPQTYSCAKCGATHYAAGRDPVRMYTITQREGCMSCRGGQNVNT